MNRKMSFWRQFFQRQIDTCERRCSNPYLDLDVDISVPNNSKRRTSMPNMDTQEPNTDSSIPDMGSTMPNIDLLIFLHYQKEERFYKRRGALICGKYYMCARKVKR